MKYIKRIKQQNNKLKLLSGYCGLIKSIVYNVYKASLVISMAEEFLSSLLSGPLPDC